MTERVNNFDILVPLLEFDGDSYYFLQVMKRRKENPGLHKNSVILKQYQIDSLDFLEKKMPSLIALCEKENARVMLDINKRSFKKTALVAQQKIAKYMFDGNFKSVRLAYDKACGSSKSRCEKRGQKKWIVDVDPIDGVNINALVKNYMDDIVTANMGKRPNLFFTIPSPNGVHIITNPFRFDTFMKMHPQDHKDVKKNCPTILFANL